MSEYVSNHYFSCCLEQQHSFCTPASAVNPCHPLQSVLQWLMAEGADNDIMVKVAPKNLHADRDGAH